MDKKSTPSNYSFSKNNTATRRTLLIPAKPGRFALVQGQPLNHSEILSHTTSKTNKQTNKQLTHAQKNRKLQKRRKIFELKKSQPI